MHTNTIRVKARVATAGLKAGDVADVPDTQRYRDLIDMKYLERVKVTVAADLASPAPEAPTPLDSAGPAVSGGNPG